MQIPVSREVPDSLDGEEEGRAEIGIEEVAYRRLGLRLLSGHFDVARWVVVEDGLRPAAE